VRGKIGQYSSIVLICRYALQLIFETFVNMINDTTGSVIFDSVRRVEQILFNICFVSAIYEHHPCSTQNFRDEIRKICVLHFLTARKLKRSTDLYETPTGNQQRE